MGGPFRPMALVVEDDVFQRQLAVTLLEDSGMDVAECESAEAAWHVLEKKWGPCVDDVMFLSKPWLPYDLVREAERSKNQESA